MKHLYRTSPKDFIKQHYKTIGYILLWCACMICVLASATYYIRLNYSLNNENKDNNSGLVKRDLTTSEPVMTFWSLNSSRATDYLSYQAQGESYADYFYFDRDTENNNNYIVYRYNGDFRIKNLDNDLIYNNLSFSFYYYQSTGEYYLYSCYLAGNGNSQYYLYIYNTTSRTDIICFDSVYAQTNQNVYDYIELGVIKYYFNYLFSTDSSYSTQFQFKEDYNFNSLVSENITKDTNLIVPYKLAYNEDPSDTIIQALIKMDFVSNNYLYKGIYLEFKKPYMIRVNGSTQQVNFFGSSSQLIVSRVYYMRSLPTDNQFIQQYPTPSTMDLVAQRVNYGETMASLGEGQQSVRVMVYGSGYEFVNTKYRVIYVENNDYNREYDIITMPELNDSSNNGLYNPYLYRNLSLYQVLNNGYLTYDLDTLTYDINGDNGLGSVFALYSQAFTGLLPLMTIQVIPGITLGLLFMIPLIATIIIVVLRLVKK